MRIYREQSGLECCLFTTRGVQSLPSSTRFERQNQTAEIMRFGEKVRALRAASGLSPRALGERVGVSHAYISKVENGKLDFGDYPSADLIRRLAEVLGGDEEVMLLAAQKISESIRRRL